MLTYPPTDARSETWTPAHVGRHADVMRPLDAPGQRRQPVYLTSSQAGLASFDTGDTYRRVYL